MSDDDRDDLERWHARIQQVGRWTYSVDVVHGIAAYPGGLVWGRQRAEAKAKRLLARYRLDESRRGNAWEVE